MIIYRNKGGNIVKICCLVQTYPTSEDDEGWCPYKILVSMPLLIKL